jgi:putative NIF3 family GTP cyclohydrolase 1 type 2
MEISQVISKIKDYHKGEVSGQKITDENTRDKILYGNENQECTGIVTTVFASIEVIRKAHELGANLIIVHEALFWNHGDQQEWLMKSQNETYLAKKKLLDDYQIVVWRNHDYVHSGIPLDDGSYVDGIFYGFAKEMGWVQYPQDSKESLMTFQIPEVSAENLAYELISKMHLEGARIIGNTKTKVRKVQIPFHIFGDAKELITEMDKTDIDALLAMELVDFSISEYVRDSSMLNRNKVIITVGHFNMEEPGMKYMSSYIPQAIECDVPCHFIQSGDTYHYVK